MGVALRVAKQLRTQDLRKLENFKKTPEMFRFDGMFTAVQILAFELENC